MRRKGLRNLRRGSHFKSKERDEGSDESDELTSGRRVSREDDESIDDDASEVGWTEEDEMAFGKLFRPRHEEESEPMDEEQEEPGEDEMLLSELLPESSKMSIGESSVMEEADEDADDEEDGHEQLLKAVEKFSQIENETSHRKSNLHKAFVQSFADSPFSSLAGSGAISMDTLFGALQEGTTGLNAVKKKLVDMSSSMRAPKQVDKVISERIERGMLYKDNKTDMNKWNELIRENRHSKTLDLTDDVFVKPSYRQLVQQYEPMTDMEKEIQLVLVSNGASEEEVESREEEALNARETTEEELRQRQAELSKVRALMFYEQLKRHRINKIKSKLYRKIRKRQQQRREGDGVEEENDESRHDEEYKRVRERMDLRHKNTGKWAQMALVHGKGDKTLR